MLGGPRLISQPLQIAFPAKWGKILHPSQDGLEDQVGQDSGAPTTPLDHYSFPQQFIYST